MNKDDGFSFLVLAFTLVGMIKLFVLVGLATFKYGLLNIIIIPEILFIIYALWVARHVLEDVGNDKKK